MNPYEKYLVKSVNLSSTQRKFVEAMKMLIKQGCDYNWVSISELCRAANLSRPTFYACFKNIGDVVDAMQDEFLLNGSSRSAKFYSSHLDQDETRKFLHEFMLYMLEKKDDYFGFLKGPNGSDQRFVEKWKHIIKYRFYEFYADRADYDFILEVISGALVSGLTYFVANPERYTREQFEQSLWHLYDYIMSC